MPQLYICSFTQGKHPSNTCSHCLCIAFAGSGYFEVAAAATDLLLKSVDGEGEPSITNATIPSAFILPKFEVDLDIRLQCTVNSKDGNLCVRSNPRDNHLSGHIEFSYKPLSLGSLATSTSQGQDGSIKRSILTIGSRTAEEFSRCATGEIQSRLNQTGFILDPAELDCTLQVGQFVSSRSANGLFVPSGLASLHVSKVSSNLKIASRHWASCFQAMDDLEADKTRTSYAFHGQQEGILACRITDLVGRSLLKKADQAHSVAAPDCMYETVWEAERYLEKTERNMFDATCSTSIIGGDSMIESAASAIATIQGFTSSQRCNAIELKTEGGMNAPHLGAFEQRINLYAASVAGLLRTMAYESPQIFWSGADKDILDMEGDHAVQFGCATVIEGNKHPTDAFGVLQRARTQYKPMLQKSIPRGCLTQYQLVPKPRGALSNLVPVPVNVDNKLPINHSLVAVKAVGINFRDVLNVLGMYPGDPGPPGGDFAGIIIKGNIRSEGKLVGSQGSRVFGLASGCLGTHAVVPSVLLAPLPSCVTFEHAASMPTVFVTTDISLHLLGELKPQSKVLVHAAAGGVGLAALQAIHAAGGVAIATAGSPFKRGVVRSQGVQAALNSRDVAFGAESSILGGADIVLNSLTSPGFVAASLASLRCGGRFVEISKRDIWSAARVAQERPDVSYTLVAVDFMSHAALQKALLRMSVKLSQGKLSPISCVTHNLSEVAAALRQMSQARHVGKVVVRGSNDVRIFPGSLHSSPYLITGGTGALGSTIATWLLENGLEKITLLGRSGSSNLPKSDGDSLSTTIAEVTFAKCDAATRTDTHDLYRIYGMQPFWGVMHAGGVLADATLPNQTVGSVRAVFAPKGIAMNRLNSVMPFVNFTLFSSTAALVGSPGQVNYSMANFLLDNLALKGQDAGQVVDSVQFGAWRTVGMAAVTSKKAEKYGFGSLTPSNALSMLSGLVAARESKFSYLMPPTVALTPFEWTILPKKLRYVPDFYSKFVSTNVSKEESSHIPETKGVAVAEYIVSEEHLQSQVDAAVLSILGSTPRSDEPLMAAGLDSLGAVELRNALESSLGLELPATLVFDYPTTTALVDFLLRRMAVSSVATVTRETQPKFSTEIYSAHGKAVGICELSSRSKGDALLDLRPRDQSRRIPLVRWNVEDQEQLSGGSIPVQFGVFLERIAYFDPAAFSISSTEATLLDPQQRLVLETSAELVALPSFSNLEQKIKESCGVFVV